MVTPARFNGSAVFGSGPTRFVDGWLGQGFDYPLSGGNSTTRFNALGVLSQGVVQRGRLVGTSPLVVQSNMLVLKGLADAPTTGVLTSGDGRSWSGITMLRIRFDDRLDVGRQASIGYTIDYGVLT